MLFTVTHPHFFLHFFHTSAFYRLHILFFKFHSCPLKNCNSFRLTFKLWILCISLWTVCTTWRHVKQLYILKFIRLWYLTPMQCGWQLPKCECKVLPSSSWGRHIFLDYGHNIFTVERFMWHYNMYIKYLLGEINSCFEGGGRFPSLLRVNFFALILEVGRVT
jgi:hypothetical protein